jgi:hypothetical protein
MKHMRFGKSIRSSALQPGERVPPGVHKDVLGGYVKLEKKIFRDKQWIITARFRVSHRRPGRKDTQLTVLNQINTIKPHLQLNLMCIYCTRTLATCFGFNEPSSGEFHIQYTELQAKCLRVRVYYTHTWDWVANEVLLCLFVIHTQQDALAHN